ncbi:short-chain dehydrogenase/reductase SDR [Reticulomyxa filosa]|uniref:Short-chain dehydrogenase/reductase SDR n=1 Tax=Reticulomyxa filosa TaxID=46433 RepID=X6NSY2_RETFI|nr:short-chain dehydrogenase/reductase SDR [Reticulomyxa filosa]|eukprot:ETO29126.1 short-chain dehydrogenase/reductase SDR [Reticulomyxa filosa]
MVARSIENLKAIQSRANKPENCVVIGCDLSDEQSTMKCIQEILNLKLTIHLLVNNAGTAQVAKASLQTCDLESWNWHHNLLLKSPYLLTKHLFPLFSRRNIEKSKTQQTSTNGTDTGDYTSIVNIGSIHGIQALPSMMAYSVNKAGLAHLTRLNAVALGKYGIRVNCIQLIHCIKIFYLRRGKEQKKKTYTQICGIKEKDLVGMNSIIADKYYPIGRLGTVDDIIEYIMFLSDSKKSGWITGSKPMTLVFIEKIALFIQIANVNFLTCFAAFTHFLVFTVQREPKLLQKQNFFISCQKL